MPATNYLSADRRSPLSAVKVADIGWLFVFNLCLFSTTIQNTAGFNYVDELATVLAVLLFVASSLSHRLTVSFASHGARCLLCLLLVVCVGLLGNQFSGLSTSPIAIAIDLFACVKMPLALVCFILVLEDKACLFRFIENECKLLALILLICGLVNLFVPLPGLYGEVRYGLRSFTFVFGHPESLVFICVGMTVALCANFKRNKFWIVALAVVACLSLRTKGFVFAALAVFLVFSWGRNGRFSIWHLLTAVAVGLLIGWDQYQAYYQTDGIARSELAKAAVSVANTYFPIGSGFASFGSNVTASIEYYSPLYYQYGLNTIYGLTPANPAFLSDTFWPIIIGQFGWLAFVVYCASILFLFLFAYKAATDGGRRLAVVICFAFLLISSTAESSFFNPQALFLVICLALVIGSSRKADESGLPADTLQV